MGRKKDKNKQVAHPRHSVPLPASQSSYRIGEHVGSESRNTEFKDGPGFVRYDFRANVAKYISAFVNSHENGRLLIGVSDNGEVKGYECDQHEEDDLMKKIDEGIKDINPHIFPQDYRVTFIPVLANDGTQIVGPRGHTFVIEIYVAGANIDLGGRLCQTNKGVYIRRDGSVQEFTASEIQEWTRRKYQSEIDRLKNNEKNMEKRNQIRESDMAARMHVLEDKLRDSEQERNELLVQNAGVQRLEAENKQLHKQLDELSQNTGSQGAEGKSDQDQTAEGIRDIRRMLEQQIQAGQKKSKVCVIS